MCLEELTNGIPNFSNWTHADKIRFFGWYLQSKKDKLSFDPEDIRSCYDQLGLEKPRNVNVYFHQMAKRKPKEILRKQKGYVLEKRIKDQFENKYGQRIATTQVDKLLHDLPLQVPSITERSFLDEAIRCFRCKAYRAAIIMSWNLAYDHLCQIVLSTQLQKFQQQWCKTFPNHRRTSHVANITKREDFEDLKESEFIQVCKAGNIITNDIFKILNEKLGKRNTAAHPSTAVISPQTAEEYIIDLITNCVLKL